MSEPYKVTTISQCYDDAIEAQRLAEAAFAEAETNLIHARRETRQAERAYLAEIFPSREALLDHFRPDSPVAPDRGRAA